MNTVFADTFYWIALTVPTETGHQRANQFTENIVTTDEVLSEYLTFFSGSPDYLRTEAGMVVYDILQDPASALSRRAGRLSWRVWNCIGAVQTRAIV